MTDEPITIELFELRRTSAAMLVATSVTGSGAWLPLSRITLAPIRRGVVAVTLPARLAFEKGLRARADDRQSEMFGG